MSARPPEPDSRAVLADALLELRRLRAEIGALEAARTEPIALVGVGCRFPGGADGPDAFWRLLREGRDAIGEVPAERWDAAAWYDPDPETPGKMYTRHGGFLDGIDGFDPRFFGIAPREAANLDPQHRLLLEVSWEALEHAGVSPPELAGSRTGVFAGLFLDEYAQQRYYRDEPESIDTHRGLSVLRSLVTGRLSYLLGVHGPSMQLDTACSSSLLAVHLACQSLRARECDLALAGGVNLILAPETTIGLCRLGAVSADGRCKTFDASADGYGRGEGCGIVVLKRLSDALEQGDTVLATVRGSAVNHDGRSNGLTAPSGSAQEAVIRRALENAGVEPAQVRYVEAHGTGTRLGDPIEMLALGAVLGAGRGPDDPLLVGSVKTNIGHLESAAGVAALIKVVLALRNGEIPPHLHFNEPNPGIPWAELPVRVPVEPVPWPQNGRPRLAGVSSFGISGTNVHLVVEGPPAAASDPPPAAPPPPPHLLNLSARDEPALRELAARYAGFLAADPPPCAGDVCYTASVGRAHLPHRLGVLAERGEGLRERLLALAAGERGDGSERGIVPAGRPPAVAFLFTGQGSQYAGMGHELYETEPVFREALDRCAALLDAHLDTPLLSVMHPPPGGAEGLLDETGYTQPALFALEHALAALWLSWGVEPAAVAGHSVGEYAAACLAGVFSLEDAARLVAARGRLMQRLPRGGAMAAVGADPARVAEAVRPHAAQVALAAVNGPEQVVISGSAEGVESVCAALEREGVRVTRLRVSHAFHSPLMDPMLDDFARVAAGVRYAPPRIPFVSALTGEAAGEELATPEYWVRHVRQPVRFAAAVTAVAALHGGQAPIFLEIGPKAALMGMGRQVVQDETARWLPSLRTPGGDRRQMLASLRELHLRGVPVRWAGVYAGRPHRRLHLPTYPFQRTRYWTDLPARLALAPTAHRPGRHPLLGDRIELPGTPDLRFEGFLGERQPPFLADHRVHGSVVLPAAAYLEMALAAGSAALGGREPLTLEEVGFEQALLFPQGEVRTVQTVLADPGGASTFRVFASSRGSGAPSWTLHAVGRVRAGVDPPPDARSGPLRLTGAGAEEELSVEAFYEECRGRGLDYGPSFRAVRRLRRRGGSALGSVALPEALSADAWRLHPVLLDACFHVLGAAVAGLGDDAAYVPVGLDRLELYRPAAGSVVCLAEVRAARPGGGEVLEGDLSLCDEEGAPVARITGLKLRRASRGALLGAGGGAAEWLYEVRWEPRPAEARPPRFSGGPGRWLLLADAGGVAERLAARLEEEGEECILAVPAASAESIDRLPAGRVRAVGSSAEDMRSLLREECAPGGRPLRGVVFLWGLDSAAADGDAADPVDRQALACGGALHLVQALAHEELRPHLWLVTRGGQAAGGPVDAAQAPLWGLGRVIALEHPELRCACLDLDPRGGGDEAGALFGELWRSGEHPQTAFRGDAVVDAVLARFTPRPAETNRRVGPVRLGMSRRGVLENLALEPATRRAPGAGEVEVRVRAAGLNLRDVLHALDLLPGTAAAMPFGFECAGTVAAVGSGVAGLAVGDRVLVGPTVGSMGSYVTVDAALAVPIPPGMGFEAAATIPLAFLTAYHGLHTLAGLRAGDRVLIHAAAGGVGQAAVQLALRAGAVVFATASAGKWDALRAMGVAHVMSSRTLDFAEQVLELTGGEGVDVVLNSLNGEFIPASLGALRRGGRFVEIGKIGVWEAERVAALGRDVAYLPFDLGQVRETRPELVRSTLEELGRMLHAGEIQPLPFRSFPLHDAASAFRFMAQARHVGKVVLTTPDEPTADGPAPPVRLRGDASYLITGGLGALGLHVARWMVGQGVRDLTLVGRHAPAGSALEALAELERAGARVRVMQADVSDPGDATRLMEAVHAGSPPLRGIVHAAGVLDDGVLVQQSWGRFEQVLAPKVRGAWHLHRLTHDIPLDFFVLFSSAAALLGSPGQASYAAANAFLDALAHQRRSEGLPALSIDWGMWAGDGMAARQSGRSQSRRAEQGMGSIEPGTGVEVLEMLLGQEAAQVGVVPVDWSKFLPSLESVPSFLGAFRRQDQTAPPPAAGAPDLLRELQAAEPQERRARLAAHLRSQVAQVLGLGGADQVDPDVQLATLGLDSLMGVELSHRLTGTLGHPVRATFVFDHPTVARMADHLCERVLAKGNGAGPVGKPAALAVEELSEEEAEALLLHELQSLDR
jgi:acyl transferase domain-containing protein/NADPH:quinone reductase-like Zn-dependent oxidoreductase/aryl carrier-like protein